MSLIPWFSLHTWSSSKFLFNLLFFYSNFFLYFSLYSNYIYRYTTISMSGKVTSTWYLGNFSLWVKISSKDIGLLILVSLILFLISLLFFNSEVTGRSPWRVAGGEVLPNAAFLVSSEWASSVIKLLRESQVASRLPEETILLAVPASLPDRLLCYLEALSFFIWITVHIGLCCDYPLSSLGSNWDTYTAELRVIKWSYFSAMYHLTLPVYSRLTAGLFSFSSYCLALIAVTLW